MADVLITPTPHRPEEQILEDLAERKLSAVLRGDTWRSHERAEFSDFEQAMVKGTITKEAYAANLAQAYFVYDVLEEVSEQLKDHPVVGDLYLPELHRRGAVEQDLAYYYGTDWREKIAPLPLTETYVAHVRKLAEEWPVGFIAHHYTRYLADLSGGIYIDAAIKNAWSLNEEGRRVYIFPEIEDFKEFKNAYRQALDELPVSVEDKAKLIGEALAAYQYNITLIEELSREPFLVDA